ncbi:MAG: Trk system potassium transporter TrkA, partial [Rhodocyclaceae bacterium]|nr:Trk system potassium transporter TrkA [Rhodocyclaceae bacterium]
MKIIILGAGQVGSSVAENLVSEANDITVVDTDPHLLQLMQNRLDLRSVVGNAASPSVMRQAGADDADLLIAVTQSDQTNLCACRIARTLFNLPTRIARLRSADYVEYPELLDENNFAVDFSICPEQIVTEYIRKLIEFPTALQVLEFADGLLSLIAVRAVGGGPLVGHPLADLPRHIPNIDARIAAIYRGEKPIIPTGETVVQSGDEVFCLAATRHIRQVMRELRKLENPIRRIMIAGGGNIGYRLARSIEDRYEVKVLER